jgi:hypothetical protein
MITLLSALISLLSFRLRSRSSLELELIALRHQVAVLRRRRPGRPKLLGADRLLWVWLYRIWPQALHAMVLVKPATVIQWHRKGFRLYWRWRSQSGYPGRPKTCTEVRNLIPKGQKTEPADGASRRLSMIIAQQPTQSLLASHWPLALPIRHPWKQQDVALPLMVPLSAAAITQTAMRRKFKSRARSISNCETLRCIMSSRHSRT